MNSSAALEMIVRMRLSSSALDAGRWLRSIAHTMAKASPAKIVKPYGPASRKVSGYQLNDAVRHDRFGIGRVLANWPDGSLLVRFDKQAKSLLIWPSFLDRVSS